MGWQVILAAALGIVVGVGVGAGVITRERGRLHALRVGVAEISRGNRAHRIILPGNDDVARISDGLNEVMDAVERERETAAARDFSQRQLLANVSHDLRTPIASIAGYVDALRRGLGDDPERYLAIVADKTEELAQLTDDLFYEARLDSGDLELSRSRLDLAEAVRRALLGFEPQLVARGVRVQVRLPEQHCPIEADPSAVARILGNLVSNALRHGRDMTFFDVVLEESSTGYTVRLTNDGVSVEQDVERLFERGVAGAGGGSGLGLGIARELVERMGAVVAAENTGPGTIAFSLVFDRASQIAPAD